MTNSEAVEYAIKFLEQDYAPIEVLKKLKDIVSALEENDKLKAEIERLKAELEQLVKLQNSDEELEKERMIIWLNDFCDKFAKCDKCIFNGRCKEFDEMDFDEIKSQYEEAEHSLKDQVEE